ncbi:isoform 4 of serine/threonine-protein phosphatase 6 regulatory ankyrin repeat subunit a [Fagus crenata]
MTGHEKEKEHIDVSNAILIAAKNGITEMVKKAFQSYPVALYDVDQDKKNIVLLTVEHKQPHVYELLLNLLEDETINDTVFYDVDRNGNTALHLAAMKAAFSWPVPGAASQMQWEIKWYEYIKNSMGKSLIYVRNKNGKTPDEVFTESHEDLVKEGETWLTNTSEACSVVAGLFVTVAFSTSTTVPEGLKEEKFHTLASKIFAGSSFVSFYTSLIAVIMFLSILTSGCRERDFRRALPWKLLLGLSAFYLSIASTLVCFTTGHFYIFRDQLISISSSSYVIACLLVTVFAILVFPLYFHLVWATSTTVPQRSYRLSIPDWLFIDE